MLKQETKKDIIFREIKKAPGYILAASLGIVIAIPWFGIWYYENKIKKDEETKNSDE